MPVYPYECLNAQCGDRTELIVPVAERNNSPSCPTCQGPMQRIYIAPGVPATHCEAILVFKAADGSFKFPGRNDAPTPNGCTRLELQPVEARRVLRQASAQERELAERYNEAEIQAYEQSQSVNRSDLFHRMKSMNPRDRAFAQLAIDYANSRPIRKAPDAEIHSEALEFDSSNREGWADRDRHGRSRK